MNLPRIFPLFIIVCAIGRSAIAEYQVGDTVVVIHDTQIKVGDKVVHEVPRGVGLKVQGVKGDWLWVSNSATGWIRKQDVATPDKAIDVFTEEIKKKPHDADAFIARGLAWFDKNEFDIAIGDLNEAIRLDPKHSSAYSSRSICWWAKREVDKAIADCSEAIRLDPKQPMYYANRGILWNMKGEYDEAIADADKAIQLAPHSALPHIVRGNAFIRKHDDAQALIELNEAVRINPREATAYGLRGRVLAAIGEYDRAAEDFEKALSLNPRDKDSCNEIARFYATCPDDEYRDGKKAVQYAQQACDLSGWHSASSISVLAAAYAEQGDFDKAVEWQEKATEMVPVKRRSDYRARLALYKAHKPYREHPRNVSSSRPPDETKNSGG